MFATLVVLSSLASLPGHTYTWKGGAANPTDWTEAQNWIREPDCTRPYPGHRGSDTDVAVFNDKAKDRAELKVPIALAGLTLADTFSKELVVNKGASLTVRDNTDKGFFMASGTLTFKGGSWLALQNLGTAARWVGGDLSSTGDQKAKIFISHDTTLLIEKKAHKLGASLIIGESPTGFDSPGAVHLANPDFVTGLENNLLLSQNAGITVYPCGVLNLNQSTASNEKGGLTLAEGSTGVIDNQGTIKRLGTDANHFLVIQPRVINNDRRAVFFVNRSLLVDCSLNGFILHKGQLQRTPSSSIKGASGGSGGGVVVIVSGTSSGPAPPTEND